MKRMIKAPKEVWEAAVDNCPFETAYSVTNCKRTYPALDYIALNERTSQRLHDLGDRCELIMPFAASLPVFHLELGFSDSIENKGFADLWTIAADIGDPYVDYEFGVYGMDVNFSTDESTIACDIGLHYSDHSGGGYEELGTILVFPDKETGSFHIVPYSLSELNGLVLYDDVSLTKTVHWLMCLWNGIQYELIHRPEFIKVKQKRLSNGEQKKVAGGTAKHPQMVKVQRIITIMDDGSEPISISNGHRTITIPVWGVSGHWRSYKSGKRIWISPYLKGQQRDDTETYSQKEYRFIDMKGVGGNA